MTGGDPRVALSVEKMLGVAPQSPGHGGIGHRNPFLRLQVADELPHFRRVPAQGVRSIVSHLRVRCAVCFGELPVLFVLVSQLGGLAIVGLANDLGHALGLKDGDLVGPISEGGAGLDEIWLRTAQLLAPGMTKDAPRRAACGDIRQETAHRHWRPAFFAVVQLEVLGANTGSDRYL